ncbi:peptidoglycan-binding protein [Candidatus Kaiserbacteria bacterium]|nr:peptidoglycan-binding protein [Candidatus Kaiserbacteria bacterium]
MSFALRLSFGAALVALALIAFPYTSDAAQVNVTIGDSYFSPKNITINAGDTVVWTHVGGATHTVTADDGSFNSGSLQNGQSYSRTFNAVGTYPYYCIPHGSPGGLGMSGTVTVVTAPSPAPVPTPAPAPVPVPTPIPIPVPTPTPVPPTTADALRAQAQALLAKVQQLQAQLGGSASASPSVTIDSSSCPNIGRSLKRGSSGEDVTRLQQFLARDSAIYPEALTTGYYGTLTEAAVKRWQAKYNIVSSGTPESTGYGVVGPRTAAAIAILCTTGSYNGVPGPSGSSAPVGGFIQVTPVTGSAPLTIAVQATVNTVTSCSGAAYMLDYGDGTIPSQIVVPAGNCAQMTQTLGHTYQYGGTYLITLSAGAHRTTATVQAYGAGPPLPVPTPTPTPTPSPTPAPSTSWGIVSVTPAVGGNPLAIAVEIDYPACAAYSIDWGDGALPSSVAAQSGCAGGASRATLNHTYSTGGTYTVSLRDGGGTVKASSGVSIVN